jgi:hypothetical protein
VPTPQPSPKVERHIRLISSLTLGNQPDGDSVISFEATDFGVAGTGDDTKYRTIATEQYSLIEPKPEARELRNEILRKLRARERHAPLRRDHRPAARPRHHPESRRGNVAAVGEQETKDKRQKTKVKRVRGNRLVGCREPLTFVFCLLSFVFVSQHPLSALFTPLTSSSMVTSPSPLTSPAAQVDTSATPRRC